MRRVLSSFVSSMSMVGSLALLAVLAPATVRPRRPVSAGSLPAPAFRRAVVSVAPVSASVNGSPLTFADGLR